MHVSYLYFSWPHLPWLYLAYFFAGLATLRTWLSVSGDRRNRQVLPFAALAESNGSDGKIQQTPPISILKPLRGADPRMYEAFRSHCLQDYPEFEIIFGVAEAGDPAVAEVERLQREFPSRPYSSDGVSGVARNQSQGKHAGATAAAGALRFAAHQRQRHPGACRTTCGKSRRAFALEQARLGTGAATGNGDRLCIVRHPVQQRRGIPGTTLASRLEALTIATDFAGGVLSAYALEGRLTFGLGSTLAVRREALEAIGGLRPLLDCLADDYELGNRMARAGFDVVLAPLVVETALPGASFGEMFQHQLRWARTIRDRRPRGYIGLGVTHVVPWALLACLVRDWRAGAWGCWR